MPVTTQCPDLPYYQKCLFPIAGNQSNEIEITYLYTANAKYVVICITHNDITRICAEQIGVAIKTTGTHLEKTFEDD